MQESYVVEDGHKECKWGHISLQEQRTGEAAEGAEEVGAPAEAQGHDDVGVDSYAAGVFEEAYY